MTDLQAAATSQLHDQVGHEDKLAAALTRSVTAEFPTADVELIQQIIREEVSRYRGARVRDFVPVFVLRAARHRLHASAAAPMPAPEPSDRSGGRTP